MNSRLKPKKRVMLAYLIPSAVVYFCVFIIPVILAVYYSFFNFKTVKKKTFIGLKNYVTLQQSKDTHSPLVILTPKQGNRLYM